MKKLVTLSLTAAVSAVISGCVLDQTIEPKVNDTIDFQQSRMEIARDNYSRFKRFDKPYISGETFEEPEPLPAYLNSNVFVDTTNSKSGAGLKYYASKISRQIGMPVRIGNDLYEIDNEVSDENVEFRSGTEGALNTEAPETGSVRQSPLEMTERLSLSGSAVDVMNTLTGVFAVYWEHDETGIRIYKRETQTFALDYLLQENQEFSSSGSASTTSDNSGGMSTTLSSTFTGATYDDYVESVENMLSAYGRASAIPGTGSIVVTDTPENLKAVDRFFQKENLKLTGQIALDIEVAMASSEDGQDVAIVWDQLLAEFGEGALSLTSSIPTLSGDYQNSLGLSSTSGKFSGSNLLLQALASKTKLSILTRETRSVLNNTPAQFRNISYIEYPSEVTQTTDEGVTTVTTEKAEIRPGFDMTLIPRITKDNRVILNVVSTMSRQLPFDEVSTDTYTQKYAQLDIKELKTAKIISDGDTAMISGFISSTLESSEQGTGASDFWGLGGGGSTSDDKDLLLIFVTPHIIKKS